MDWRGCAVTISHDRCFLDRIATYILAWEGGSHVEWFEGDREHDEKGKKGQLGIEADQAQRVKYRRVDT